MADTSNTLQSDLRASTGVTAPKARARRFTTPHATIAIVSFLLIWQLASVVFNIPTYLLPSPLGIVDDAMLHWRVLLHHTGITTFEVAAGFILSVLIGLPLAALLTFSLCLWKSCFPR